MPAFSAATGLPHALPPFQYAHAMSAAYSPFAFRATSAFYRGDSPPPRVPCYHGGMTPVLTHGMTPGMTPGMSPAMTTAMASSPALSRVARPTLASDNLVLTRQQPGVGGLVAGPAGRDIDCHSYGIGESIRNVSQTQHCGQCTLYYVHAGAIAYNIICLFR